MSIITPIKSKFAGYYEIPGFSKYAISKAGKVINKETGNVLDGHRQITGYHKYTLINDNDKKVMSSRHRLLCMVFKNPQSNFSLLHVNHINNIPGDDNLNNLEWVTPLGNMQHAAKQGRMSSPSIRVQVRDIDTFIVEEFSSRMECARKYGLSRDQVAYRLAYDQERIYPERKQYRFFSNDPWPIPSDIDLTLMNNGTTKQVSCFNVITYEERFFDKIGDMANFLEIAQSTLSLWLSYNDMRVNYGGWLVKYCSDQRPWRQDIRSREDAYCDYNMHSNFSKVVQVTNTRTNVVSYYWSAKDAADAYGLNVTALDYRLKSNGNSIFSDGCRYGYFPY